MAKDRKSKMDGLVQRAIHSAILACLCLMMTFVFATDLHAATQYTITVSAGSGGTVTPATATVNSGASQTFTITPTTGFNIAGVTVDGVSQGAITSYTFTNVTATHTIAATFAINSPSSSNYFYDDLGRLTRVIQGTSGVIYNYDELGNLISVTNATTANASPVISSISPNVLFVGTTMIVIITGQNLLTTETVTSNGGLVTIDNVTMTDTRITAEMTALSAGTDTIKVTTRNGSPNTTQTGVTLTSSKLSFIPGQLAIVPGGSGTITASISPPLTSPLTINLISSDASVATVPQSVIIPVSGSADFAVNALRLGNIWISCGEKRAVVFVTPPFSGEVNGLTAGNVSVYIDAPATGTTSSTAMPVSVYLDAPTTGPTSSVTLPVSVYLEAPSAVPTPTTTRPVSVFIDAQPGTSPTVAGGVSVKIQ